MCAVAQDLLSSCAQKKWTKSPLSSNRSNERSIIAARWSANELQPSPIFGTIPKDLATRAGTALGTEGKGHKEGLEGSVYAIRSLCEEQSYSLREKPQVAKMMPSTLKEKELKTWGRTLSLAKVGRGNTVKTKQQQGGDLGQEGEVWIRRADLLWWKSRELEVGRNGMEYLEKTW